MIGNISVRQKGGVDVFCMLHILLRKGNGWRILLASHSIENGKGEGLAYFVCFTFY